VRKLNSVVIKGANRIAFSTLLFEAFGKVQDEVIQGVIHSVLVMIDGGNELSDKYLLDLIKVLGVIP
jgi:hypothetical protein